MSATPIHHGSLSVYVSDEPDDVLLLQLYGELDLANAESLEAEIARAEAGLARQIVVDLSGLDFIDSTGLRVLVEAYRCSRADGDRLRLLRGRGQVQKVLMISGLDELLPFLD